MTPQLTDFALAAVTCRKATGKSDAVAIVGALREMKNKG